MRDNPFERFDLDPRLGPSEITRRLRELMEDAGEPERAELRRAWEELTLHPWRRLHAAVRAHPESRAPLGAAPIRRRVASVARPTRAEVSPRVRLVANPPEVDLLEPPPLEGDPILEKETR
jgi:hypothetical protein